jgi:hypothetical protein
VSVVVRATRTASDLALVARPCLTVDELYAMVGLDHVGVRHDLAALIDILIPERASDRRFR